MAMQIHGFKAIWHCIQKMFFKNRVYVIYIYVYIIKKFVIQHRIFVLIKIVYGLM